MKLYLLGGFLGSGKTTAIATACKILFERKQKIAVVMNDQGAHLVDAALAKSLDIPHDEVRNGCFCCNYNQFHDSLKSIDASIHPEIIFAEAVGSCTDLVATIINPMQKFNPEIVVSFSVLADGQVLLSSLQQRSSFINEDIRYIYQKQLEEAGLIIVNKSDTLSIDDIAAIKKLLDITYPGKTILFQDSTSEESVKNWLRLLESAPGPHNLPTLKIDYDKYADGEAALAWLDALVTIHAPQAAIRHSFDFINEMRLSLSGNHLPIGHLKFFVQSGNYQEKLSFTSHPTSDNYEPFEIKDADRASVMVNARVEAHPDQLKKIFYQSIKKLQRKDVNIEVNDLAAFQPGYPKPTHRIAEPIF